MSRIHDAGGKQGYGAVETADDEPGFHHEWEARVFLLNRILLDQGRYTLDEFRYTIEQMDPEEYLRRSYYERWLIAIEQLLVKHAVIDEI